MCSFLIKITKELTRYVPYRFIRPWYGNEMRGLKDSLVNSRILELQNESAPYTIDSNLKNILFSNNWKTVFLLPNLISKSNQGHSSSDFICIHKVCFAMHWKET